MLCRHYVGLSSDATEDYENKMELGIRALIFNIHLYINCLLESSRDIKRSYCQEVAAIGDILPYTFTAIELSLKLNYLPGLRVTDLVNLNLYSVFKLHYKRLLDSY